jgi:hypothetical protein
MRIFQFFVTGLAVVTCLSSTVSWAQNRGSIQIQGADITQNVRNGQGTISESWAQATPITKKEGRQKLANLENQLTAAQKAARTAALQSAINFMNSCPAAGCTATTRSYPPGNPTRVDVNVFDGVAFTGTAPQ